MALGYTARLDKIRFGTAGVVDCFLSAMEKTMTKPDTPTPAEIEELQHEADDLEKRAEADGILPDDEAKGDGVGRVTGLVP